MTFRPSTCLRLVGIGLLIWLLLGADWTTLGQIIARVDVTYLYAMLAITTALVAVLASMALECPFGRTDNFFYPMESLCCLCVRHFCSHFHSRSLGRFVQSALRATGARHILGKRTIWCSPGPVVNVSFMVCMAVWAVVHIDLLGAIRPHWGVIVNASHINGLGFAVILGVLLIGALSALPLRRLGRAFGSFISSLRKECETLVRLAGWHAAALTGLAYTICFVQTVALARGLGLPLGAWDIITSVDFIVLASLLSLSVAGLGTREGGLAPIMAYRAVPDSLEVFLAYSALFIAFFIVPGLLGFACFWHRPLSWQALCRVCHEAFNVGGK